MLIRMLTLAKSVSPVFVLIAAVANAQEAMVRPAPPPQVVDVSHSRQLPVSFTTPDGGQIFGDVYTDYDQYGHREHAVVLAHGEDFDKDSWRPQAIAFATAGFRVLAFDFRGYGRSRGPRDVTNNRHHDVLGAVQYVRATGAKMVTVVGAGSGGKHAVDAAEAKPELIDQLVLLEADVHAPIRRMKGPKLFVSGLPYGDYLRTRAYELALGAKEFIYLNAGSANAQEIFETSERSRLTGEILRFLGATFRPFSMANLRREDFKAEAKLRGAQLQHANLREVTLLKALLGEAQLERADLSDADLREADLSLANLTGAHLYNADMREAVLVGATLKDAHLIGADLRKADLSGTTLTEARLAQAKLSGAILVSADLSNATLIDADLSNTDLRGTNLSNVHLLRVDLAGAIFEPRPHPRVEDIVDALNLWGMTYHSNPNALVELRKAFRDNGFRDKQRQITYALKKRQAKDLLDACPSSLSDCVAYSFETFFFDLPSQYGMNPARSLKIFVTMWFMFAFVYVGFIHLARASGIYLVAKRSRRGKESTRERRIQAKARPLAAGWRAASGYLSREWLVFRAAMMFSVMSAFNLGFREINFGRWLRMLMKRDYEIKAVGWARTVSGVQSLVSVYLIALWLLTYFGQPFE